MPLVNGRFVADMKSPRTPDNEEPAAERACDFRPVDKGFTEEMALGEAERCLNCKKPFCVEGCPVNINIPRFIEQIRAKDFGGALDTIREDSSASSSTRTTSISPPTTAPTASRALSPLRWSACCRTRP